MLKELVEFGRSIPELRCLVATNRQLDALLEEAERMGKLTVDTIHDDPQFRLDDGSIADFNLGLHCYRCDFTPEGKNITSLIIWDPHFDGKSNQHMQTKEVKNREPGKRHDGDVPQSLYVTNEELMLYGFSIARIDSNYRGTLEATNVEVWGRQHKLMTLINWGIDCFTEALCQAHANQTYTLAEIFRRKQDEVVTDTNVLRPGQSLYIGGRKPIDFADYIGSHYSPTPRIPQIDVDKIILRPKPAHTQRLPEHILV